MVYSAEKRKDDVTTKVLATLRHSFPRVRLLPGQCLLAEREVAFTLHVSRCGRVPTATTRQVCNRDHGDTASELRGKSHGLIGADDIEGLAFI
jgi:hypothetical protein